MDAVFQGRGNVRRENSRARFKGQARRQEMKWGCFVKKSGKLGVFFCKKVDFSSMQGALCTLSVFFILHFTYLEGGAYAPNVPLLPMGLEGLSPTEGLPGSHQTVHTLFLANDRCLRDYALLVTVSVRPNVHSPPCLAIVQFGSHFVT